MFWSVRRPFPEYDGTISLPALAGEAEVIRDEHGIPQIYADTAEDLFRAQGYVHAQDRFWEMDFHRHVTAGRLSELFGEDQVDTDTFIRAMGWRRTAAQELPLLSPATRRYLEAYAEGVNGWLAGRSGGELGLAYTLLGLTGGDNTPEPWRPVDSLAWLKAMAWDLRGNMEDEDRPGPAGRGAAGRADRAALPRLSLRPKRSNRRRRLSLRRLVGRCRTGRPRRRTDPGIPGSGDRGASNRVKGCRPGAGTFRRRAGRRLELVGRRWLEDSQWCSAAGERPASRPSDAVDLVPGGPALPHGERGMPVPGRRLLVLRRARRGHRAQRPHRLGIDQSRP